MANGIELATAYVSIVGETKRLDDDIRKAFKGADRHAAAAGTSAGRVMGKNAADKMSATLQSELRGEKIGKAVGTVIGKSVGGAISLAIKGATVGAAAGVAGIGATLFKGFERYKSLDATARRLQKLGKTGAEVKSIMGDITSVVEGTPIALDAAAKSATQFLAGGVKQGKELKTMLTAIADAAGFSGDPFDEIAAGFTQVQNAGKLMAEDVQNQFRNLPVIPWLAKSMGTDPASVKKMISEGQVGMSQLIAAVQQNAGGMAKAAGQTIEGALGNMQTAIARVGANFISAIFGDPLATDSGPNQMVQSIDRVTDKLDEVNGWIAAHQGEIKQFFTDAAETAKDVGGAVKDIGVFLAQHKEILVAAAGIWAGWKALTATATVLTTLKAINTALAVTLPVSAATGAAGVSSAIAGITAPAWLLALLGGGAAGVAGQNLLDRGFDVQPLTGDVGGSGLNPLPGTSQSFARGGNGPHGTPDPTGGLLGGTIGLQPLASGLKQRYAGMGITGIGGYSATVDQPWDEHQTGNAIDVPVGMGPGSVNKGNAILADALAQPGVHHVIWQKKTYYPDGRVVDMGDRGSPTENHMDHVHINARATGGGINGPGGPKSDSIPAWLSDGEHVLTAKDVAAMGGQGGVYAFRNMLHRQGGGSIFSTGAIIWPREPLGPSDKKTPGGIPPRKPGGKGKGAIALPDWSVPGTEWGPPPDDWWLRPVNPDDILFPENLPPGSPWRDPHGKWKHPHDKRRIRGFAEGGAVGDEQVKAWLAQGVPEEQLIAQMGATPEQIQRVTSQQQGAAAGRTEGYTPATAGYTGKTGGGVAGSLLNLGAEAINGLIDQAVQAASSAASMASMAGSFGTDAGAGGAAASMAIKIGGEAAKRGVKYAAELGGIGIGALTEIFSPFGAPRWLTDVDPTAFMPNWQPTEAATTTAEQGQSAATDPNLAGFPNVEHGMGQGAPPGPTPDLEALDVISQVGLGAGDIAPAAQPPMFHVDNIYAQDPKDVADQLNKRGRLNMMQYAGRP